MICEADEKILDFSASSLLNFFIFQRHWLTFFKVYIFTIRKLNNTFGLNIIIGQ